MNIKRDTLSKQILELTAISGELPPTVLNRLKSGEEYMRKTISALKQADLIRKIARTGFVGYRLTPAAKKMLLSENERRFEFYLRGRKDTNMVRNKVPRRLRLHRIAEIYLFMLNADVLLFRDLKTPVFEQLRDLFSTASTAFTDFTDSTAFADPDAIQYQDFIFPAFYESKEIKEVGALTASMRGSRHVGILLSDELMYAVYNTEQQLMRWDTKTEIKFRETIYHIFRRKVIGFDPVNIRALIIGATMDIAVLLLESTGGEKGRFFQIDDSFDYIHYISNDETGEMILKILLNAELMEITDEMLTEKLDSAPSSVCSAADSDGNPVLLAYTYDIRRIQNFAGWLAKHDLQGILYCFDFQRDSLQRYCNENRIEIRTLDSESYRRRYLDS